MEDHNEIQQDIVLSDVIKNAVYRQNGRLTTAFQKEKHDTVSQLLKEYADRNWSRR